MADYTLQTLAPLPGGWRVVYWDGVRHHVEAVFLVGLANNPVVGDPPVIATFTYTPTTAWEWCEGRPDYCGLLPPGGDLGDYEAHDPHGHVPVPGGGS